jgi:hypothetical protein
MESFIFFFGELPQEPPDHETTFLHEESRKLHTLASTNQHLLAIELRSYDSDSQFR